MDKLVRDSFRRRSVKNGFLVALIGGAIAWGFGLLLSVLGMVFGSLVYQSLRPFHLAYLGLSIFLLMPVTFLPLALLFAALVSIRLTRRRFGGFIWKPYIVTVVVATLLLSAVSVPVWLLIIL